MAVKNQNQNYKRESWSKPPPKKRGGGVPPRHVNWMTKGLIVIYNAMNEFCICIVESAT